MILSVTVNRGVVSPTLNVNLLKTTCTTTPIPPNDDAPLAIVIYLWCTK